jgi:hypothetical protein
MVEDDAAEKSKVLQCEAIASYHRITLSGSVHWILVVKVDNQSNSTQRQEMALTRIKYLPD